MGLSECVRSRNLKTRTSRPEFGYFATAGRRFLQNNVTKQFLIHSHPIHVFYTYTNDHNISKSGSIFWCSGGNKRSRGWDTEVLSHKVVWKTGSVLTFRRKSREAT
jgi:hypothetical protein